MLAGYTIGVDLGGTNLRVATYAGGSDFLESTHLPTRLSAGRDQVVRDICEAISSFLPHQSADRSLLGIGIGSPGPLELPGGIIREPPNLPGWDGFNLRKAIETQLGHTIHIESDGNLAALAEQKLGAGKTFNIDSLCTLTLGTGVGAGIVLNGRIWHGFTGMGGECGHIVVDPHGVPCGCGGFGCLEQYASATAILRMAKERMGTDAPASSYEVAALARSGDERALSVFTTVGESLGIALTAVVNSLNFSLNLIGGGASEAWDLFSPALFQTLHRHSYVYRLTEPSDRAAETAEDRKTYIRRAQLGSQAGLLGACLLPLQQSADSSIEAFMTQR